MFAFALTLNIITAKVAIKSSFLFYDYGTDTLQSEEQDMCCPRLKGVPTLPKEYRLVVTGDTEWATTVVELEHQILAGMSPWPRHDDF